MTIKTKLYYTKLSIITTFVAKYCIFGYLVSMLFFVYQLSPPVWYYYPLLVLLLVATHKIQLNLILMLAYYINLNSGGDVNNAK